MNILPFQPRDAGEVLRIHRENYKGLHLERFTWQPCQQIESLEKNCFRLICKDEWIDGYAAVYALDKTHFRLNLIVAPENKRRGIATKLLFRVER